MSQNCAGVNPLHQFARIAITKYHRLEIYILTGLEKLWPEAQNQGAAGSVFEAFLLGLLMATLSLYVLTVTPWPVCCLCPNFLSLEGHQSY